MKLIAAALLAAFTLAIHLPDTEGQVRQRTQTSSSATKERKLLTKSWTVKGIKRTALVYVPQTARKPQHHTSGDAQVVQPPLIFGFHGHGGTSQRMVPRYRFHELWPEAVVVYPQGLNTQGKTDPEGKKPGWQNVGGIEGDRDLDFFDVMLASMTEDYNVDPKQIYLSGHSNGAGFSYLLLTARNSKISAIAVSAGGGRGLRKATHYQPRPVLHIAGRKDTVVPFRFQELTIRALIRMNKCEEKPTAMAKTGQRHAAKDGGADVVFWPHDGTHRYPKTAPELMIKFLKRVSKGTTNQSTR